METRAHHVMIGAFALGLAALAVLFAIWLGRQEFATRYAFYEIVFADGVAGLNKGADVRYSGIKVGQVEDVRLDPANPANVRVIVRLDATTPVSMDSRATLETGILTGLSVVQLSGGSENAKPLETLKGQDYPIIPSEKTGFQELFVGAPELIAQGNQLLASFNAMLNPETMATITGVINDVKTLTGTFAESSAQIETIIQNAEAISADLRKAAAQFDAITSNIEAVTANANGLVEREARALLDQAKLAVQSMTRLADQTEALVRENRPALRDFARGGLPQIVLFIQEARELFDALERLSAKIESDPGQFLFGTGPSAYTPSSGGSR